MLCDFISRLIIVDIILNTSSLIKNTFASIIDIDGLKVSIKFNCHMTFREKVISKVDIKLEWTRIYYSCTRFFIIKLPIKRKNL